MGFFEGLPKGEDIDGRLKPAPVLTVLSIAARPSCSHGLLGLGGLGQLYKFLPRPRPRASPTPALVAVADSVCVRGGNPEGDTDLSIGVPGPSKSANLFLGAMDWRERVIVER